MIRLAVAVIIDAFITGGVKAVEDILKALGKFLADPKATITSALGIAAHQAGALATRIIEMMQAITAKLKNGAKAVFEDFNTFVDHVYKWFEGLFGGRKINDLSPEDIDWMASRNRKYRRKHCY